MISSSAEGVCGNSQAKGPDLDDTLESVISTEEAIFWLMLACDQGRIFQVNIQRRIELFQYVFFLCFYVCCLA